jgi:hypothetical protein
MDQNPEKRLIESKLEKYRLDDEVILFITKTIIPAHTELLK